MRNSHKVGLLGTTLFALVSCLGCLGGGGGGVGVPEESPQNKITVSGKVADGSNIIVAGWPVEPVLQKKSAKQLSRMELDEVVYNVGARARSMTHPYQDEQAAASFAVGVTGKDGAFNLGLDVSSAEYSQVALIFTTFGRDRVFTQTVTLTGETYALSDPVELRGSVNVNGRVNLSKLPADYDKTKIEVAVAGTNNRATVAPDGTFTIQGMDPDPNKKYDFIVNVPGADNISSYIISDVTLDPDSKFTSLEDAVIERENRQHSISSIHASASFVDIGETMLLTADIKDQDINEGYQTWEDFTFSWKDLKDNYLGTGQNITCTAPLVTGTDIIFLTVTDGEKTTTRPIAVPVTMGNGFRGNKWDPLTYNQVFQKNDNVYIKDADGNEIRLTSSTTTTGGNYKSDYPVLSPDGTMVGFVRMLEPATLRLWVAYSDGTVEAIKNAIADGTGEVIPDYRCVVPTFSADFKTATNENGVTINLESTLQHLQDLQKL